MACMSHVCTECDHEWFDNERGGQCPECGSFQVQHLFDEHDSQEEGDSEVKPGW